MNYQTFRTRKEAQVEIAKMIGWTAKAIHYYLPDDANADRNGNAWVIVCDHDKVLRQDGYVR